MKKRMLVGVMGLVLTLGMTGCGEKTQDESYAVQGETVEHVENEPNPSKEAGKQDMAGDDAIETEQQENVQESIGNAGEDTVETKPETIGKENNGSKTENTDGQEITTDTQITKDLTFADLSKLQFEFSSGAGAWAEQFTIEKDGYFTGSFYDADMGDTGEDYEEGTYHVSSYSGHFTDLTKINEYTYEMTLADITYEDTPGTVMIWENQRTLYTDSWGLMNADTLTIYLPGTPLDQLTEDVVNWISLVNESETELTMTVIENKVYGHGIYSYDRLAPYEDAQMTYDTYKESYDYYSNKLSNANTTLEMVEYTATMYEYSDDCLNYIWNLIRYNVEETKYQEILKEQREWIQEKEKAAQESADVYTNGSFATVDYNAVMADMTIKRCEELLAYLK